MDSMMKPMVLAAMSLAKKGKDGDKGKKKATVKATQKVKVTHG
jgi:hypothetical protein